MMMLTEGEAAARRVYVATRVKETASSPYPRHIAPVPHTPEALTLMMTNPTEECLQSSNLSSLVTPAV